MNNIRVGLQPIVNGINLPTVIKTAVLPGDSMQRLFVATQVGEIFVIGSDSMEIFLDIRSRILALGRSNGGYDERGLLGMAFHPNFTTNGLFYLYYSLAGTQGPGALSTSFQPNPCNPETLNLTWTNRETRYDHIDTLEEWVLQEDGEIRQRRTLLNLRRPFANHNGVNSLNFSPETGRLVLTTGDGGSGYDPFNLSQDDMEIAGKIIEIDVSSDTFIDPPVVTRFDELPEQIRGILTVLAKGVRNIPGIAYQRYNNQYIKYVGNVGQDLVESVFSFIQYNPLPVNQMVQARTMGQDLDQEGFVNLGWRGWEGSLPTMTTRACTNNNAFNEYITAYYDEAIRTSDIKIPPLTCYYHRDPCPGKINGTALTGVQAYLGNRIPELYGSVVFTDFAHRREGQSPVRGALAYTRVSLDCRLQDYQVIDVDYNFGSMPAFYTCLGTNQEQSRLFLGVYGSANVTDYYLGSVYEIIP